jgi:hypothetical protein
MVKNTAELIKTFEAEKNELRLRIVKIEKAIDAIRDLCVHDWAPDGNDSHYDYEKCTKCGLINKL